MSPHGHLCRASSCTGSPEPLATSWEPLNTKLEVIITELIFFVVALDFFTAELDFGDSCRDLNMEYRFMIAFIANPRRANCKR